MVSCVRGWLGVCVALVAASAACGPPRMGFEMAVIDATLPEADPGEGGTEDARRDVVRRDTMEAAVACDMDRCDEMCVLGGAIVGICRTNASSGMLECQCRYAPGFDGGGEGGAGGDAAAEASVLGCTANTECPPSMFCNNTMCEGAGYCAFRGEEDAGACPMTPETRPSCGCDGRSYPSTCARLSNGVRLAPNDRCMGGGDAGAVTDAASPGDAASGG